MRLVPVVRHTERFWFCHSSRCPSPDEAHDLFPISPTGTVVADGTRGAWEFDTYHFFDPAKGTRRWHYIDHRGEVNDHFVFLDLEAMLTFIQGDGTPQGRAREAEAFMFEVLDFFRGGEIPIIHIPDDPTAPGIHPVHFRGTPMDEAEVDDGSIPW
jgi:hypothetical protein